MKRLAFVSIAVLALLLMGCEGDDPSGPGGTLPTVTGLAVLATSSGNTVELGWEAVTGDIEGYEVYFDADGSKQTWVVLGTTTATTYTHEASSAGIYSVRAYDGDNYSSNYAESATTMPIECTSQKTIWDNHAPESEHSGFMFNSTGGSTVHASTSTNHDLYCYDGDWQESPVGFYSGDMLPFGDGNETWMHQVEGSNYGAAPGGTWWDNGYIVDGDVIFAELFDGYFVKILVDDIPNHAVQPISYGITFHYEWQQIQGLSLFTTKSN